MSSGTEKENPREERESVEVAIQALVLRMIWRADLMRTKPLGGCHRFYGLLARAFRAGVLGRVSG
jgi:hypothetical protein